MQITAIHPRRKSLVEIELDGQPAGEVDYEVSLRLRLRVGQTVTDAEWSAMCAESDCARAKSYALWLLGRQSCTEKKLCDKLRERYGAEAAQAAVARMRELNLIDDADYARRCAEELFRCRHFSELRVVQELCRRGIDRDTARNAATEAAQEYQPEPRDAIAELLQTRFAGKFSDEAGRRRTVAALQRMGYRWADIRAALAQSASEPISESE